jgi:hypothetical protein
MHLQHSRLLSTFATAAAILALGASPALAGEDDDGDDDGDTPAAVSPGTVTSGSDSSSDSSSVSGAPSGGVETGAGGTAPQSPDGVLLALASGALVLVAAGGGVLTAVRRPQS